MPQYICDCCFKKLKVAFDLKKISIQSDIYLRALRLPQPAEVLNDMREISCIPHPKIRPCNYQPSTKPATQTSNHFMIQDQITPQQSPKHFIIEESKVISSLRNSIDTNESKEILSQPKSSIQKDLNSHRSSKHFIIGESKVTSSSPMAKKPRINPPINRESPILASMQSPNHLIITDESQIKQNG